MAFYSEYLKDLAKRNRLDDRPELDSAVLLTHFRQDLSQKVEKIMMSQTRENAITRSPFEIPGNELSEGKYYLADLKDSGRPILVLDKEITHLLVAGKTEIGKTSALYRLIDQIVKRDGRVWIIEMSKKEAKNLIRLIPGFRCLPLYKFRQNIFGPFPGMGTSRSIEVVTEIISSVMGLMTAASGFLISIQDKLRSFFAERGHFCLSDVIDFLRANEPKRGTLEHDYWERNLVRMEKLKRSSGGTSLDCQSGFPTELLEEENLVIEGMGTDLEVAEIRSTRLIFDAFFRRLGIPKDDLKPLYVCIDDAHLRLFDRARENSGTRHLLTQLPNVSREVKMIFLIGSQSPKNISDSIHENSSKLLMNVTDIRDLDLIAKSTGLTQEQREYCYELKTGEGVLKLISDRWNKPIPVMIPHFEIPHDVTDEEAEEHSSKFIEEMSRCVIPRSTSLIEKLKREKDREMTKEEEMCLLHIVNYPFLAEDERRKAIGFTSYKMNRVMRGLVVKGFVVKKRFYTGKPGNQPILQEPTNKAKAYLKAEGIRIPAGNGKGGIVHQNWARIISEYWTAKGMETFIEPSENGANTDVLVIDPEGRRTAVEIALSPDGQVNNILRDLEHFDRVIMAAETGILLEKIKAEAHKSINGDELNRVKFCLLQDFLN